MSKTKLLYVLHGLGIGGTEIVVASLARYFQEKYDVSVLALDYKGEIADELSADGIKVYCLSRESGWKFSNFKSFFKIIKELQPDIIHAHQYTPYFFSAAAKLFRKTAAKLIFTEHGRFYPDVVSWKRRLVNQLLLKVTDQLTAVCSFTKRALEEVEGMKMDCEVVYNGVHVPETVQLDVRKDLDISTSARIVCYLGSFRPVKNPVLLLRAFIKLRSNVDNVYLVFVGDGELRSSLETLVDEHDLSQEVLLLGNQRPATPYLYASDIFVQPSLSEANSLALLEAQAFSKPAVVTDVGGAAEVVVDGVNGFLVESGDADMLAEKIRILLEDSKKYQDMSEAASRAYQEGFTQDIMFANYAKIYERLH